VALQDIEYIELVNNLPCPKPRFSAALSRGPHATFLIGRIVLVKTHGYQILFYTWIFTWFDVQNQEPFKIEDKLYCARIGNF